MRWIATLICCLVVSPVMAGIPESTVRVSVSSQGVTYSGSGTAISRRHVLTCWHTFRGTPRDAVVTVKNESGIHVAKLLSRDESDADLALLEVAADLQPMPIATLPPAVSAEAKAASYHTGVATVVDCQVVAKNRFKGAENLECNIAPQQGQSGGGLFVDGQIVGVCLAVDQKQQRGLFTSVAPIWRLVNGANLDGFNVTDASEFVVREAAPPRKRRVLFITATWCEYCHQAIDGRSSDPSWGFRKWLEASHWKVDETDSAHVQLVDYDSNHEVIKKYNLEGISLPTMLLIDNEAEVPNTRRGYTGRQSLLSLLLIQPSAPVRSSVGETELIKSEVAALRRELDAAKTEIANLTSRFNAAESKLKKYLDK